MRFRGLKGRHIGPFAEIDIDLDAIPGLLVAVCGVNGAGKSTFLELMTGGLMYRECENRGNLLGLASARDSFIEGRVVNGQEWTVRHDLDGIAGKGESFVYDAAGKSQLESPLVSRFDAWAGKKFPPSAVAYASTIAPQKGKGFLELSRGERMAVLLRAIGGEELERQAKECRDKAESARKRIDVTTPRLSDEKARGGDVAAASVTAEGRRAEVAVLERAVADQTEALGWVRESHATITKNNAALEREVDAYHAAQREQRAAFDKAAALRKRLDEVTATLSDADAVRAAVARVEAVAAELAPIQHERADLRVQIAAADDRRRAATRAIDQATDASKRLTAQKADEARKLTERDRLRAEAADLDACVQALTDAQEAEARAETDLEDLRQLATHGAEGRIASLTGGLGWYADPKSWGGDAERDRGERARAWLGMDAEQAAHIAKLPESTAKAKVTLAAAKKDVGDKAAALARRRDAKTRADAIEIRDVDEPLAEQNRLAAEARGQLADADADHKARTAEEATLCERARALTIERGTIDPVAAKAAALAGAQALAAELEAQDQAAADALAEAHRVFTGRSLPSDSPAPLPDVALHEERLRAAERALGEARTALALAEKALDGAQASALRIAELETSLSADREEQADFLRAADAIDGVKLMEVDNAGPALTASANDLLHSCVGSRFTVRIETQRPDAKGKKMIDGVDVQVIDSSPPSRGAAREGAGETFSPGEQVVLNEALSLALAILHCDKSHATDVTLIRDETGSALDPASAKAYVGMLRRAAAKVNASHVLFVTHSPEVIALADARITVKDGRLSVSS